MIDRERAHGLNLLDGTDEPDNPPTIPINQNDERSRNQIEAFKKVYVVSRSRGPMYLVIAWPLSVPLIAGITALVAYTRVGDDEATLPDDPKVTLPEDNPE